MPRTGTPRGVMTTLGLQTLPARVDAADPTGLYADGSEAAASMDANGRTRVVLSSGAAGAAQVIGTVPGIIAASVGVTGRVVAPGAGAAIATIAAGSLPAGVYDVQVSTNYDGAAAAAEINNMEFRRGAVVVSSLEVPAIANLAQTERVFRVVLDGATAISVNATGVGTAAVGYTAELVATRVA